VRVINAGRRDEALAMLDGGTTFAKATQATVMAIRALQADLDASQPVRAARPPAAAQAPTSARREPLPAEADTGDWHSF
jgi:hypothetical protein